MLGVATPRVPRTRHCRWSVDMRGRGSPQKPEKPDLDPHRVQDVVNRHDCSAGFGDALGGELDISGRSDLPHRTLSSPERHWHGESPEPVTAERIAR